MQNWVFEFEFPPSNSDREIPHSFRYKHTTWGAAGRSQPISVLCLCPFRIATSLPTLVITTWDALEVTEYGKPFEVTSSKMTVNVQDDIKYAHFLLFVLQSVLKQTAFKEHYRPDPIFFVWQIELTWFSSRDDDMKSLHPEDFKSLKHVSARLIRR